MHKSVSQYRDGFKAHIAIEPETGIITASALTAANAADGPTGITLLDDEEPGLQVLADSAYGSGPVRAELRKARHHQAIKPLPLARNPRLGEDQFNRDDFTVDHLARTATCPAGQTVTITARGWATFGARCKGCPLRSRCTSSKDGKTLQVSAHDAELVAARKAWRDGEFTEDYRQWRPMVERSISWLVATRHRRVRYRSIQRNHAGLQLRVAAINLRRIINLGLDHADNAWIIAS